MAEARDREFLLGIFLMEAWDTAGTLEEGLALLSRAKPPTLDALAPLILVCHRLKGSAALHGFPGVSELATVIEQLLERAPEARAAERVETERFVRDAVALLKELFDRISSQNAEDTERIASFKARHARLFAAAPRPPAPVAPPMAPKPPGGPAPAAPA